MRECTAVDGQMHRWVVEYIIYSNIMYNLQYYTGEAHALNIIQSQCRASPASKYLKHSLGHLPPSAQVVDLLLALHPLGSQYNEDGVLEQEVADEQAAKAVIVPLLVQWPNPALGLVELSDQPQTALVGVVAHPLAKQSLVEVETLDIVALPPGELRQQAGHQVPRLALLLHETQDLVDLVGNHVPVLVLMQSLSHHVTLGPVWVVFAVCPHRAFAALDGGRSLFASGDGDVRNGRFFDFNGAVAKRGLRQGRRGSAGTAEESACELIGLNILDGLRRGGYFWELAVTVGQAQRVVSEWVNGGWQCGAGSKLRGS